MRRDIRNIHAHRRYLRSIKLAARRTNIRQHIVEDSSWSAVGASKNSNNQPPPNKMQMISTDSRIYELLTWSNSSPLFTRFVFCSMICCSQEHLHTRRFFVGFLQNAHKLNFFLFLGRQTDRFEAVLATRELLKLTVPSAVLGSDFQVSYCPMEHNKHENCTKFLDLRQSPSVPADSTTQL